VRFHLIGSEDIASSLVVQKTMQGHDREAAASVDYEPGAIDSLKAVTQRLEIHP
jgi:hypothetical protein